jgi:hypothetical protein
MAGGKVCIKVDWVIEELELFPSVLVGIRVYWRSLPHFIILRTPAFSKLHASSLLDHFFGCPTFLFSSLFLSPCYSYYFAPPHYFPFESGDRQISSSTTYATHTEAVLKHSTYRDPYFRVVFLFQFTLFTSHTKSPYLPKFPPIFPEEKKTWNQFVYPIKIFEWR